MPRVVRRQKPPALANYRKYKPYLRLDFNRRCAYCQIPEARYGPPGNFTVDHFRPKSRPEFRRLLCVYSNLFYACRDCNLHKGASWPGENDRRLGRRFLNPCQFDLSKRWTVDKDGCLIPLSQAAEYMIEELRLNRPELLAFRTRKVAQLARIQRLELMLSEVPRATFTRLEGQKLLDAWKRELAEEFEGFRVPGPTPSVRSLR